MTVNFNPPPSAPVTLGNKSVNFRFPVTSDLPVFPSTDNGLTTAQPEITSNGTQAVAAP